MSIAKHWRVEIHVEAEHVLTIEDNSLSGVPEVSQHTDTIRNCAQHLLGFIGETYEQPEETVFYCPVCQKQWDDAKAERCPNCGNVIPW